MLNYTLYLYVIFHYLFENQSKIVNGTECQVQFVLLNFTRHYQHWKKSLLESKLYLHIVFTIHPSFIENVHSICFIVQHKGMFSFYSVFTPFPLFVCVSTKNISDWVSMVMEKCGRNAFLFRFIFFSALFQNDQRRKNMQLLKSKQKVLGVF